METALSAEPAIIQSFAAPREAVVAVKLNLRASPSRQGALRRRALPDQVLRVAGLVHGEDYLGESGWFQEAGSGLYFWAGGVRLREPVPDPAVSPPMRVNRRGDGTIRPLGNAELEQVFGRFSFRDVSGGAVEITDAVWQRNLVPFKPGRLVVLGCHHLQVHAKVLPAFTRVFQAIEATSLADRILGCGGTFVPRHKGWDSKRELSSHSWGVAIDLNVPWNGYGVEPALLGRTGCLRELVPLFAQEGFAWGGHFSGRDRDGMHFELARLDV